MYTDQQLQLREGELFDDPEARFDELLRAAKPLLIPCLDAAPAAIVRLF